MASSRKVALVTGITGQDGSYLAEFLLEKGYEVHGIIRRSSSFNTGRIEHLYEDPNIHRQGRMQLHYGDLTDSGSLVSVITSVRPTEVYNLAAQSHVKISFDLSEYTAQVDALGTLSMLQALRSTGVKAKFYQASSSELFGSAPPPQNENTPFHPRSPYAVSKMFSYWIVINYREAYGMFASNGILFNHESPRRGESFVTRKITRSVAKIHLGLMQYMELGNLESRRDWGHAKDYVEAMWIMLQQDKPGDYVIATGETRSVREFVEAAFGYIGRSVKWVGTGLDEQGVDGKTGQVLVKVNPKLFRPAEVDYLLGDPSKSKKDFGWTPKTTFDQLVKDMMDHDLELMRRNPHA